MGERWRLVQERRNAVNTPVKVRTLTVIEIREERGEGTPEDPRRKVLRYTTTEGVMLAEYDRRFNAREAKDAVFFGEEMRRARDRLLEAIGDDGGTTIDGLAEKILVWKRAWDRERLDALAKVGIVNSGEGSS